MTIQSTAAISYDISKHLEKYLEVKQSEEKSSIIKQDENKSLLEDFKSETAKSLKDLQHSYTQAGNNLSYAHKQEMAKSMYYSDLVARNISQTGQTHNILDLIQKTK